MHFLVTAYDYVGALERRLAARAQHLTLGDEMIAKGELKFAAALLDDKEQMIGSVMVTNFSSRTDLDAWLKVEPYVTNKVWERIEVQPCRPGPKFTTK